MSKRSLLPLKCHWTAPMKALTHTEAGLSAGLSGHFCALHFNLSSTHIPEVCQIVQDHQDEPKPTSQWHSFHLLFVTTLLSWPDHGYHGDSACSGVFCSNGVWCVNCLIFLEHGDPVLDRSSISSRVLLHFLLWGLNPAGWAAFLSKALRILAHSRVVQVGHCGTGLTRRKHT